MLQSWLSAQVEILNIPINHILQVLWLNTALWLVCTPQCGATNCSMAVSQTPSLCAEQSLVMRDYWVHVLTFSPTPSTEPKNFVNQLRHIMYQFKTEFGSEKGTQINGWVLFYGGHFKFMDSLNIPYTIFLWVLKLLTSDECHRMQIRDSNHTHFVQYTMLLAKGHKYRPR